MTTYDLRERKTLLFDLDGTITNSFEGIEKAARYSLGQFGIEGDAVGDLSRIIGPPLLVSFSSFYGFDRAQAIEATNYFREYYMSKGKYEATVFDGIPELLRDLDANGTVLTLATSKVEHTAIEILEHFDLAQYFGVLAGASMDESRSAKGDVIEYALQRMGACDESRSDMVMIGDRHHDMTGALMHGLIPVGVTYGFGDREELENAGAAAVFETVKELRKNILGD